MRIAYVCADPGIPVFGNKGASIHVQEVVAALRRQGAEVELFAARVDGTPPPELVGVSVHSLPTAAKGDAATREASLLAANEDLYRALADSAPFDVIYERYSLWSFAGMEFARDHGLPGLLEVNAPLIKEQAAHRTLIHTAEAHTVAQRAFGAASALLPVSAGVGEYLANFSQAQGKIHILPNGVDPRRFAAAAETRRHRSSAPCTIGFVGTLKAWHGVETLIEAFALFHARTPHSRLLIVGDGPCRDALTEQVHAAGLDDAVEFTGAVSHVEVPALLARMDIAVAPYPQLEDFYFSPLKLYEYMAAGLPTVASDVGQIAETITHAETGLLYPPGDIAALVASLDRLAHDPALAHRLGTAGRARVLAHHTWDGVAERILRQAAAPPPSSPAGASLASPLRGGVASPAPLVDADDPTAKHAPSGAADQAETSTQEQAGPTRIKRAETVAQSLPGLRRILHRFRREIAGQWHLLLVAFIALWLNVGLRLLEPWPLKIVVDLLGGQPLANVPALIAQPAAQLTPAGLLIAGAIGLVFTTAGRAAANYAGTLGLAVAGNRILIRARSLLYTHLLHLPLAYHAQARTGDLLTRLIGDVARLQEVATTALLPLAVNMGTLVGMLGIMLWLNWQLALLGMLSLPLASLLMRRQSGRIRQAARRQRAREGALAASAAETLNAMPVVHTFGLQSELETTFQAAAQKDLKESVRTTRYAATLERSVDVCIGLGLALTLWYGGSLALSGILSPGDLVVFMSYLKSAYRPINDLAKYTGRLAKAIASGERVLDVLDTQPAVTDQPHARPAPARLGAIQFHNVSFAYGADRPALQQISFAITPGSRIALVGPSGGGKSTLLSLLPRLYDPTAGTITVDGIDLREFSVDSWRARLSVVPQVGMLFGVSIAENIAYGARTAQQSDISRTQIEAAARLANAHEFIMQLPQGYDTVLSEGGSSLSGGQRQRIAIARAAIRDAQLVLLDEPTTGLDNTSAHKVLQALERLVDGRTSIWISHDLISVRTADLILFIENGRIAESGTHAQLMAQAGRYADLYRAQDSSIHQSAECASTVPSTRQSHSAGTPGNYRSATDVRESPAPQSPAPQCVEKNPREVVETYGAIG